MSTFLADLIVLLLVVACILIVGIIGVRFHATQPTQTISFSRVLVLILILALLAIAAASAVIAGHGDRVWDGALAGAWGGALLGAWVATRKSQIEIERGEAFVRGLAETLDGALVGAVVGGFLLDTSEAWKGAFLGAVVGIAGWGWGRLHAVAPSDAPIPSVVRAITETWMRMRCLTPSTGRVELSIISTLAEALMGGLFAAVGLSIFFAAVFGWWGFPY